jgi:hypothetical protein
MQLCHLERPVEHSLDYTICPWILPVASMIRHVPLVMGLRDESKQGGDSSGA